MIKVQKNNATHIYVGSNRHFINEPCRIIRKGLNNTFLIEFDNALRVVEAHHLKPQEGKR